MRRNPFERVKQAIDRAEVKGAQAPLERASTARDASGMVTAGGIDGLGNWSGFWQLGVSGLSVTTKLG